MVSYPKQRLAVPVYPVKTWSPNEQNGIMSIRTPKLIDTGSYRHSPLIVRKNIVEVTRSLDDVLRRNQSCPVTPRARASTELKFPKWRTQSITLEPTEQAVQESLQDPTVIHNKQTLFYEYSSPKLVRGISKKGAEKANRYTW